MFIFQYLSKFRRSKGTCLLDDRKSYLLLREEITQEYPLKQFNTNKYYIYKYDPSDKKIGKFIKKGYLEYPSIIDYLNDKYSLLDVKFVNNKNKGIIFVQIN